MVDYISSPSRLRRYFKDPRAPYYYFNKAIRKPAMRRLLFRAIRILVPKHRVSSNVLQELAGLQQDGIVFWDSVIGVDAVSQVHHFLADKPVHDLRDVEKKPLDLATLNLRETMKVRYFDTAIAQSEDLVRLANQDKILSLVAAYFGCKPTITIMEAWWTKTGNEPGHVLFQDDMYHRDVEDFKFIKLFVYLTDVAASNGAHCFIRGSQRSGLLTQRMPISDDLVAATFATKDNLVLTGKTGCGFLEDTWGLHRSLPAKTGERLLFSVTYSLTAFNPYSPSALRGRK